MAEISFVRIAPYLKDPLVLLGFGLFLSFLLLRFMVTKGIFPQVTRERGFFLLNSLFRYGFILGLLIIPLAFWLRYQELRHSEGMVERQTVLRGTVGEIAHNLGSLDRRVGYIAEAFQIDDFEQSMEETRKRLAPALQREMRTGYRKLIAEQRAASLRHMFNSAPLTFETTSTGLAFGSAAEIAEAIRRFYDALREVQYASESMFSMLKETAEADREAAIRHYEERLALEVRWVVLNTQVATVTGLNALHHLQLVVDGVPLELPFVHLSPRSPLDDRAAAELLGELLDARARLTTKRQRLVEQGREMLRQAQVEYSALEQQLRVQENDSWSQVVAKAISLRQLGRIPDAVQAFSRYGEMFSASDTGAERYSRTAIRFTMELDRLPHEGGVYVFELRAGAVHGDLKVGDIIVTYGDFPTTDVSQFVEATRRYQGAKSVAVRYLRQDEHGRFEGRGTSVDGDVPGIGVMPI